MQGADQFFVELASVLNLSVEFVRQNSREVILEYSRYVMLRNVVVNFTFFGIIAIGIFGMIYVMWQDYKSTEEKNVFLKRGIIVVVLSSIVPTALFAIPYFLSPYLYGVEQVMKLIK